jgi:hypothetical protein
MFLAQVRETKASQLRQTATKKRLDETVEVTSGSTSLNTEDTSLSGTAVTRSHELVFFLKVTRPTARQGFIY